MYKRCNIMVVDKKNNYPILFKGFRKNKFKIDRTTTVLKSTKTTLKETTVFFVVLYEPKDIIQIVKLAPISKAIIIGTDNVRLFSQLRTIEDYPIVDLLSGFQLMPSLQEALGRFYNE